MPTTCEVLFDNNPYKVAYAGELVRGTVRLTLTDQKKLNGIYIHISGKAHVQWSEDGKNDPQSQDRRDQNGEPVRDNTSWCTADEDYLNETSYLVGGSNGDIRLMPGTHEYAFQCMLPGGLPSSIVGQYGYVKYTTSVVLDIPMWPKKEIEEPFTVIRAINLNADLALRAPIAVEESKTFSPCCFLFCCPTDPLKMVARAPVGGYTPGQTINLEIAVNNQSNLEVTEFTAQLIKEITYSDRYRQKVETLTINTNSSRGCSGNATDSVPLNIQVPPTPPTDTSTKIIQVRYSLRIFGTVEGCHLDPEVSLPITIGTYPIQDDEFAQVVPPNRQPMASSVFVPMNNVIVLPPIAPQLPGHSNAMGYPIAPAAPSAPELPTDAPPTYEESTHMTAEDGFKPRYPMFKRQMSYSKES